MSESNEVHEMHGHEIDFALRGEDVQNYLRQVRPHGYACLMCGSADVGPTIMNSSPDEPMRAYPDTVTPAEYAQMPAGPERLLRCASGVYNIVCGNCGFTFGFNAGMVAMRTKLWKERGDT